MEVYVIMIGVLFLICALLSIKYKIITIPIVFLFVLCFSYMLSLTKGLIDLPHYERLYNTNFNSFSELLVYSTANIGTNEPFFLLTMYVSKFFYFDFQFYRFIYCSIALTIILNAFLRFGKNSLIMFVLFLSLPIVIFLYTNVIRQGLSIALFFLFVSLLDKKDTNSSWKFLIALLAILTHYSAIVPVASIYIFNICKNMSLSKLNYKFILYSIFVFLLIALSFVAFDLSFFLVKVLHYLTQEVSYKNIISFSYTSSLLIVFMFFLSRKNYLKKNNDNIHNYYFVVFFICTMALPFDDLYNRLLIYKTPLEVVILVRVLFCYKYISVSLGKMIFLFFIIYFSMNLLVSPAYKIFI